LINLRLLPLAEIPDIIYYSGSKHIASFPFEEAEFNKSSNWMLILIINLQECGIWHIKEPLWNWCK
jgi:hypothetical protein